MSNFLLKTVPKTKVTSSSRAIGDSVSAVAYFEESIEFLSKLPRDDMEVAYQNCSLHFTDFLTILLC